MKSELTTAKPRGGTRADPKFEVDLFQRPSRGPPRLSRVCGYDFGFSQIYVYGFRFAHLGRKERRKNQNPQKRKHVARKTRGLFLNANPIGLRKWVTHNFVLKIFEDPEGCRILEDPKGCKILKTLKGAGFLKTLKGAEFLKTLKGADCGRPTVPEVPTRR